MYVSVSKPSHPAKTKSQRRVLDEIGCGNNRPAMTPALRKRMLELGLIVECAAICVPERLQLDLDAGTPVVEMPVVVHIEWCAYQAHMYELEMRKKK
jgi:hypothetical protein